jgi:hypothetical protein
MVFSKEEEVDPKRWCLEDFISDMLKNKKINGNR